jgi:hypothetical protein
MAALLAPLVDAARLTSHVVDAAIKSARSGLDVELEARLGVQSNGAFCTDVGAQHFRLVLNALESFDTWSSVTEWIEMEDFFFSGDKSRAEIRSRVSYLPRSEVNTINVEKHRIALRDVTIGGGFSARICASVENPVKPCDVPKMVMPTRVVLKRRRSFVLGDSGRTADDPGGFRFDCSEAWFGRTRTEAVQLRASGAAPAYSIEVEALCPLGYISSRSCGCEVLALSLLMKLDDLARVD